MRFKRIVCCLLAGGMLSSAICHAGAENVYVATSHDTKPAPEQVPHLPPLARDDRRREADA